MPYPIDRKLVIAIASSALFDLGEADHVFQQKGEDEYREYQRKHCRDVLAPGVAFPFIRRLLSLNLTFPGEPVEVVLLSRNDPDTGLRVFHSIGHHKLGITRAGFLSGKCPFPYLPAFNTALFLSANADDVQRANDAGHAAGTVLKSNARDDENDNELRIAFDFDGVLVDDEAEIVFQQSRGDLDAYQKAEVLKARKPLNPGPLHGLLHKLSFFQKLERKRQAQDKNYQRVLRTAIITARSAPAHERVVTTLLEWGVVPDETFFLGGIEKRRILEVMRPHIFFDDQRSHLIEAATCTPSVHIPFGIANSPASGRVQPEVQATAGGNGQH